MKKIYIVSIHSTVDLIANSSTEIFVVDKNKVKQEMKELFEFCLECEIDYETSIVKFEDDSYYKDDIILPEYVNPDDCYLIHSSINNPLFENIIRKFFNPIEIKYKDD